MILIANREELERNKPSVRQEIMSSVELDCDIITSCYESQSEEYGPLIAIIDEGEMDTLLEKYPIIKEVEPEDYVTIFQDESENIERTCFIIGEAGFIVYIRKKEGNV